MTNPPYKLINILNNEAEPLQNTQHYEDLLQPLKNAQIVLLGEASHGTQEFYQARMQISKRLIESYGFMAVAIEGDWPDVYEMHRYVKGDETMGAALDALKRFQRFPTWMWRNTLMPSFLDWLKSYNSLSSNPKVGFYGLDLYSLFSSIHAVIDYLMKTDPKEAIEAKKRYSCFGSANTDPQLYGYLVNAGIKRSCMNEVIAQLIELQNNAYHYLQQGIKADDEYFFATQNARLIKNAEHYYRSMLERSESSWNIRDKHMTETVNVLLNHLEQQWKRTPKIIIWAHNSHVGDAKATEMGERGEINLGQLIREQYPNKTYNIGFSTYQGTVTAACDWDEPAQKKMIKPGLASSYEALFHEVQLPTFSLSLNNPALVHYLHPARLQRAIGVIYRPDTERDSHYFFTHLPEQFDRIIHFDTTSALTPLG